MNLHHIRYFLRLADRLHFWQTAEQLGITQSSLSRHIQGLEQELGFALLERRSRTVRLTAAGQLLQAEWTRLLAEFDAVQRHAGQLSRGEVGSLRLGHVGSVAYDWLPRLLQGFTARYPLVALELHEIGAADSEQQLLSYQLDAGFWREPARNPALVSEPVFAEPLALAVPAAHPVRADTFTSLAELRDERFILSSFAGDGTYAQTLRGMFAAYGFAPRRTITSDFGATILSLVAAGLGVAVLPMSYAASPAPGLRFLPLPHHTTVYLTARRDDPSVVVANLRAEVERLVTVAERK
ncbi:LysR family transcriptional regulator [Hymenobacter sp. 15J16-1T3B]|uniref:LysR family transcriptional regulator n=1 Tax=Hymenobacter sp. 15J16-1T3B TaxID=2886941 RepID=UPI001D12FB0A|nr:LysR substrate-binding domain-containing protein [Hymenobacter sp. 15J16-1T3B]MCC3160435.1 LysR family transcriptional regulator [Hymenobacter sp. 15J16-1T3B]